MRNENDFLLTLREWRFS